ncbi:radical SAM protein, partial [Myxococcota bacterium]
MANHGPDMPHVVVIEPPLLLSQDFIDYPYFAAIGGYQAAAVLRGAGCSTQVVDGFADERAALTRADDRAWMGVPRHEFLDEVAQTQCDAAVIHASPYLLSPLGRAWLRDLVVCASQLAPGRVVLAEMFTGGMHYVETDPGELLEQHPEVSLILRYEGEPLIERLAAALRHGVLPEREVWENHEPFPLDDLPPPAFDLMSTDLYFRFLGKALGSPWRRGPFPAQPERTLPLITSRGCSFGCIFCSRNPGLPGERRQVRAVPLERVEAWVSDWVDRHGIRRLIVLDELANLDARRFDGLLDLLERHRLRVEFPNGLRADCVTEPQVGRLARMTTTLKTSLESGSWRVQTEVLGKRLPPESVERLAGWCRMHGLPLDVHCMIGIPGETRDEILTTLQAASRLFETYGARPLLQNATPLPGTPLHQMSREQGWLLEQPDDLEAAFQHNGVLATDEFDPEALAHARAALQQKTTTATSPKVIVNLTYRCNNHCVFCAVGDRPTVQADLATVTTALRRYREEGFELLDIDGGEPTLHSDLLTVIDRARDLDYTRICVITNGRRLSYRTFANSLAQSAVSEVLVSLHAPDPSLQARLTGVAEAFEQTVAGIRNILRALPTAEQVAVNTTVVADNVDSLPRLADLIAGLGVQRWNIQVVTPFGRAHAGLVPSLDALRGHLGPLLDAPKGMTIQVINCPPCALPGHESATFVDFAKTARDMVFVGAEGENLQAFLAHKRTHTERCAACFYQLVCPGEYVFEE